MERGMIRQCACGREFQALPKCAWRFYAGPLVKRSANAMACSKTCATRRRSKQDAEYYAADPDKYRQRAREWSRTHQERARRNSNNHKLMQRAAYFFVKEQVPPDIWAQHVASVLSQTTRMRPHKSTP